MDKQSRVGLELIEKHEAMDPFTSASVRSLEYGLHDGLNSLTRPCQVAECLNTLTDEEEN